MIRILRNIRQNFLKDGKVAKYLAYSAGEIVLVMIGILLALQVNNWNENRRSLNIEIDLLSRLKLDLENNLTEINGISAEMKSKIHSANIILNSFSNLPIDSLKALFEDISGGPIFNNSNTSYRSISNSLSNAISNIGIRYAITSLYERDFPNIHAREDYEYMILNTYYMPVVIKNFKYSESSQKGLYGHNSRSVNYPQDIHRLSNNDEFFNALVHLTSHRESRFFFLNETASTIEASIDRITVEIDRIK